MHELEARMGEILAPFQEHVDNLTTIPGVSDTTARVLAGEIGLDMSRFPTVGYLISWAGLCSKLDESAGKHRSVRIRKGAPWLKTALISAAWFAVRTTHTYLRAQFARLKARRGAKKAIVAVAASMLTAAFHIIHDRVVYRDTSAPITSRGVTPPRLRSGCSSGSKDSAMRSRRVPRPLLFQVSTGEVRR